MKKAKCHTARSAVNALKKQGVIRVDPEIARLGGAWRKETVDKLEAARNNIKRSHAFGVVGVRDDWLIIRHITPDNIEYDMAFTVNPEPGVQELEYVGVVLIRVSQARYGHRISYTQYAVPDPMRLTSVGFTDVSLRVWSEKIGWSVVNKPLSYWGTLPLGAVLSDLYLPTDQPRDTRNRRRWGPDHKMKSATVLGLVPLPLLTAWGNRSRIVRYGLECAVSTRLYYICSGVSEDTLCVERCVYSGNTKIMTKVNSMITQNMPAYQPYLDQGISPLIILSSDVLGTEAYARFEPYYIIPPCTATDLLSIVHHHAREAQGGN
jgi:hypothetical protein